jgi:hypothetical protein
VVVLLEPIRFFVLSQILSELVLAYQIALNQQIQRIVNGGPAYPVVIVFHADVE